MSCRYRQALCEFERDAEPEGKESANTHPPPTDPQPDLHPNLGIAKTEVDGDPKEERSDTDDQVPRGHTNRCLSEAAELAEGAYTFICRGGV